MIKKILLTIIILITVGLVFFFIVDEPVPQGKKGKEAELLADKMLNAINYDDWQNTEIIAWEFPGGHLHTWDKKRHFARVQWDDYTVVFQIDSLKGLAYKNGEQVSSSEASDLIQTAWEYWANDSFWLNAPAKIRDGGTERQLVELENGEQALLVLYHGGGVTPGDKYLWGLDENHLPVYCKMWVSIIPVGGVKFSWEDWQTLSTGAKIAQSHKGIIGLELKNIRAGKTVRALFPESDPFSELDSYLN